MPPGLRSSSPRPSAEFISVAQASSSSSGMPMKLPITRETTGWATSVTRSHSPRSAIPSSTATAIARIASSCSAIRFGVKPRWKSILSRPAGIGSPHESQTPYDPSSIFSRARATRRSASVRFSKTPTSVSRLTASVVPSPTRLPNATWLRADSISSRSRRGGGFRPLA